MTDVGVGFPNPPGPMLLAHRAREPRPYETKFERQSSLEKLSKVRPEHKTIDFENKSIYVRYIFIQLGDSSVIQQQQRIQSSASTVIGTV